MLFSVTLIQETSFPTAEREYAKQIFARGRYMTLNNSQEEQEACKILMNAWREGQSLEITLVSAHKNNIKGLLRRLGTNLSDLIRYDFFIDMDEVSSTDERTCTIRFPVFPKGPGNTRTQMEDLSFKEIRIW
jgi:hypothetical protein